MKTLFDKTAGGEKGAASILVILMLLVLVTLGAFAVTSASANLKFSRKAAEWNEAYYELDAMGEQFLAAFDGKLAEAESAARQYVTGGLSGTETEPDAGIFSNIYLYFADMYIRELAPVYSGLDVSVTYNGLSAESILASLSVEYEPDEGGLRGIRIAVRVKPPEYQETDSGTARYGIESWYEYQGGDEAYEEPPVQLWDGSL